jgi:hypothetical protein
MDAGQPQSAMACSKAHRAEEPARPVRHADPVHERACMQERGGNKAGLRALPAGKMRRKHRARGAGRAGRSGACVEHRDAQAALGQRACGGGTGKSRADHGGGTRGRIRRRARRRKPPRQRAQARAIGIAGKRADEHLALSERSRRSRHREPRGGKSFAHRAGGGVGGDGGADARARGHQRHGLAGPHLGVA